MPNVLSSAHQPYGQVACSETWWDTKEIMTTQLSGKDLSNREFFIRRWEQEFPGFVQVIRALPSDQLVYRPHPKSRSAGDLVALLVSLQHGCIDLCTSERSSFNTEMRWHPAERSATLEEMIAAYQLHHNTLAE